MKITYSWLKDYVQFNETAQQLAEMLTEAGFEVEELLPLIPEFTGVVCGKIESVEKHPNADKLSVCSVTTGDETFQVICGAPNVAAGQVVPFAQVKAVLPNGFKIKKAKIRGIESYGMICSKEELGLEKASEGIWAFEEEMPLGVNVYELLSKEQDYLYDFFITPNRPDCLSLTGIAREVAAATGNSLRLPEAVVEEALEEDVNSIVSISIDDPQGCPRYAARVIRNVKLSVSPAWMQKRLEAVGVRPINNIVDITNYVLMELGHPLHAFDLNEVKGSEIRVRASKKDEKFTTLDDKERVLPEETVMICDKERSIAIGGIMGGLNSEVTDKTTDILLEAAYFKPQRIAKSGKRMGLSSEASQRFERGADPNGVIRAINRAAALIKEYAGGEVVKGICDVYPETIHPKTIPFRPARVNRVLGSALDSDTILEKLRCIELAVKDNAVTVPTFRVDLLKEIDLVEEVARLVNFANLPARDYTSINYETPQSIHEQNQNMLRHNLVELGLQEAFTSGMLKSDEIQFFLKNDPVTIINPISDDMTTMRPSLLPGLLKAVSHNINRNITDIRLFEMGRIFTNYVAGALPQQPHSLALVLTGHRYPEGWSTDKSLVDFYDVKGLLESFLSKIFLDNFHFILYDNPSYFSENETIAIKVSDEIIGYCGKINSDLNTFFGIENPVFGLELDVDKLSKYLMRGRKFNPVPKYPYAEKDMALVIENSIAAADILEYVRKIAGPLLSHLDIFDVFSGGSIEDGKKSLAIRMRFQSLERTLSDKEVDKIFRNVITQTGKKFNASLRN